MMSNVKSLKGNVCAQVFADDNFVLVDSPPTKADAGKALKRFAEDVGAPNEMVFDNAPEQLEPNSEFQKQMHRLNCKFETTEPYSPWQNRCEGTIDRLRRR